MARFVQRQCAACGQRFDRYPISAVRASRPQFCSTSCRVAHRASKAAFGAEARFWSKVKITIDADACWPWTGRVDAHGYGHFDIESRPQLAHRFAFLFCYGEVPNGLNVLHRCDNPPCCNPDHLFSGTQADNVADMIAKGRKALFLGKKGEENPAAKLSETQVIEIMLSSESGTALSAMFGVSSTAIYWIKNGRNWKHISGTIA